MAELADAMDSKSIVRKGVWVQVPLRAQKWLRVGSSAVVVTPNKPVTYASVGYRRVIGRGEVAGIAWSLTALPPAHVR